MAADFLLELKSTLDFLVNQKVEALQEEDYTDLQAAEVDDMAQTDAVLGSAAPALIWQFGTLSPNPRPPMYDVEFMVGSKTVSDAGNYKLMALLTQVRDLFEVNSSFSVFDYTMLDTEDADTTPSGYVFVSANEVNVQQFDNQSGLRYAVIRGKAVAYG